jgi:hypothetical protein
MGRRSDTERPTGKTVFESRVGEQVRNGGLTDLRRRSERRAQIEVVLVVPPVNGRARVAKIVGGESIVHQRRSQAEPHVGIKRLAEIGRCRQHSAQRRIAVAVRNLIGRRRLEHRDRWRLSRHKPALICAQQGVERHGALPHVGRGKRETVSVE